MEHILNQDSILYVSDHLHKSEILPLALTCTTMWSALRITNSKSLANLRNYTADHYVEMAFRAVINDDLESITVLFNRMYFKMILYPAYGHIYLMANFLNRKRIVDLVSKKVFFNRRYFYNPSIPTLYLSGVEGFEKLNRRGTVFLSGTADKPTFDANDSDSGSLRLTF